MKEGWMKNDEGWWFQAVEGFCWRTDEWTDICDCRVASATEKKKKKKKNIKKKKKKNKKKNIKKKIKNGKDVGMPEAGFDYADSNMKLEPNIDYGQNLQPIQNMAQNRYLQPIIQNMKKGQYQQPVPSVNNGMNVQSEPVVENGQNVKPMLRKGLIRKKVNFCTFGLDPHPPKKCETSEKKVFFTHLLKNILVKKIYFITYKPRKLIENYKVFP